MESRTVVVVDWIAVVVELWTRSVAEGIDSAGPERGHATRTIRTRGSGPLPLFPNWLGEIPSGGVAPSQNGVFGAPGPPLSPAPGYPSDAKRRPLQRPPFASRIRPYASAR